MAEMIPDWFAHGPASERSVWRALQQRLPKPWVVWHQLTYSSTLSTSTSPGEMDFLCYHPQRGLLAIEVKGGALSFENGRWFQEDHVLNRSPYTQIFAARAALRTFLCAQLGCRSLSFPLATAVWLSAVSHWEVEPLEAQGITLYVEDLADPEAALERLLPPVEGDLPQVPNLEQLKRWFSPCIRSQVSWGTRRTLADARLLELTLEQSHTLDAFTQFPRLRVRGCAGSGKTLLALRRAYQLIAEGKRVLLLCFNLLLAEHLRSVVGDMPLLRIEAVNELFLKLLGRDGDAEPEFWHQLARDVVPIIGDFAREEGYDAIIVDEGQDFSALIWEAVKALVPPEAAFIIFYDPEQNIFQRDLNAMPQFPWPEAVLTRNCRNTRAVCQALQPYAPPSMAVAEDAPDGESVESYTAETKLALRARLSSLLERLIEREGVPAQDIVLMGAHARERMLLETITERFPAVRYFTYRKFKGLEAPVLILLDVDKKHFLWDRAAHYTAISRAIHKLILLNLA